MNALKSVACTQRVNYHNHCQLRSQRVIHGCICLEILDSHILHSRQLYFSHSSSFCCNPSCNHMRFLRVICGGHRRFVDSTGIRLSFFTTYPFPQACRRAWRCKPSFAVANAAVSATSVVPICYYKTCWIWATYGYVSHPSKLSFLLDYSFTGSYFTWSYTSNMISMWAPWHHQLSWCFRYLWTMMEAYCCKL